MLSNFSHLKHAHFQHGVKLMCDFARRLTGRQLRDAMQRADAPAESAPYLLARRGAVAKLGGALVASDQDRLELPQPFRHRLRVVGVQAEGGAQAGCKLKKTRFQIESTAVLCSCIKTC